MIFQELITERNWVENMSSLTCDGYTEAAQCSCGTKHSPTDRGAAQTTVRTSFGSRFYGLAKSFLPLREAHNDNESIGALLGKITTANNKIFMGAKALFGPNKPVIGILACFDSRELIFIPRKLRAALHGKFSVLRGPGITLPDARNKSGLPSILEEVCIKIIDGPFDSIKALMSRSHGQCGAVKQIYAKIKELIREGHPPISFQKAARMFEDITASSNGTRRENRKAKEQITILARAIPIYNAYLALKAHFDDPFNAVSALFDVEGVPPRDFQNDEANRERFACEELGKLCNTKLMVDFFVENDKDGMMFSLAHTTMRYRTNGVSTWQHVLNKTKSLMGGGDGAIEVFYPDVGKYLQVNGKAPFFHNFEQITNCPVLQVLATADLLPDVPEDVAPWINTSGVESTVYSGGLDIVFTKTPVLTNVEIPLPSAPTSTMILCNYSYSLYPLRPTGLNGSAHLINAQTTGLHAA